MKYFYDTEFLDDGNTIEFISIGMVAEDGREYYAVTDNEDTIIRARRHPWLSLNVVSHLPVKNNDNGWNWDKDHKDFLLIKSKQTISREITTFLRASESIEYWAWYSAYDHVVLAQLFGRMRDLPLGFPMWTNDIKQEHMRLGFPRIPEQLEGAHNALEDARWNKSTYEYLQGLTAPKESVLAANPRRTRIW